LRKKRWLNQILVELGPAEEEEGNTPLWIKESTPSILTTQITVMMTSLESKMEAILLLTEKMTL